MKNRYEDTAFLHIDKLFYNYFVGFILHLFLRVVFCSLNKTLYLALL